MHDASQVGQHFNLLLNFELLKRRHYPIIPTGMRYNIKCQWEPGHQCESFNWSIQVELSLPIVCLHFVYIIYNEVVVLNTAKTTIEL